MSERSKNFGRIRYVEPNDILKNKNGGNSNIPHPYEDYSISVDLIVDIPSRYGIANNKYASVEVTDYHSGSVSFFNGYNNYLTDNVTSTTYKDILNNKDTKESLGITNIHITYNSYFYPEVTINFTDVRGASLMMPHEENYMRDEVNKYKMYESKMNGTDYKPVYTTKCKNFFTSLFSFPYPEFKLQVKGFYGKKVEFSLIVSNFRSSFNNSTGNFDVVVEFIGKMYGVYTDIPMSYLLLSPYCRYGSSNNLTLWQQNKFKFDDGTEIPTFLDLKRNILTINHEIDGHIDNSKNEEFKDVDVRLNTLQRISNEFSKIKKILSENKNVFVKDNIILCKIIDGGCSYLYPNGSNELFTSTKNLYELIKIYNGMSSSLPYLSTLKKPDSKIGETGKVRVEKNNDSIKIISSGVEYKRLNLCPYLAQEMKVYLDNNKKTKEDFYMVDGIDLYKELETQIDAIRKKREQIIKETTESTNLVIERLLGFKPSVKNIVHILMAHLHTFMQIFNMFIKNTTGLNSRNLSDLGLSMQNISDIKSDKLPPFPALKDSNTNEFVYPSPYYVNGVMEENILIESLFDSVKDFNEILDSINKLEEIYLSDEIEFIPTCITDFLSASNPYKTTLKNGDDTNGVDWIFTYFGIRCMIKMLFERVEPLTNEEFGKLEAYNFWRVNKDLRSDIIDALKNNDCNSSKFINFLLNKFADRTNNPYLINDKPCYINDAIKTSILSITNDGKLTSNDTFNFPAILCRNNGNFKTFLEDTSNESASKYSFNGGKVTNCRPFEFIRPIEKELLDEWNNNFNSFDSTKYIDDERKKILINRYLGNNNLFIDSSDITYRTGDTTLFYTYYKGNIKKDDVVSLKDCQNDSFNGVLDSMMLESIPLFFHNGIGNEDKYGPYTFLMSIPHNINFLANSFKEGKTIITIPKSTILFIGMVIYLLKKGKDYFNVFIEKIGKYQKWNINDFKDLYIVINCLMRGENNSFNESSIDYNPVQASTNNSIIHNFFDNSGNLLDVYKYDYLDLSNKFINWVNSEDYGGFSYFFKAYYLSETNESNGEYKINLNLDSSKASYISYNDSKIITNENKTIKGEGITVIDRLKSLCKNISGNVSNNEEVSKIILNRCYKSPYNDFSSSDSPFTDRYRSIKLGNDGIYISFNENFSAYEHLDLFLREEIKFVIPYQMKSYNNIKENRPTVEKSVFEKAFTSFKKKLLELYNVSNNENGDNKKQSKEDLSSQTVSEGSKYSMYRTLKNLYDKHLANLNFNNFDLNNLKDNEFSRFHFVDSYYNDISDKLMFNLDIVVDLISKITDGYESGKGEGFTLSEMSVYSFLSNLCQRHNSMLMALPIFNRNFKNENANNLEEMFTPQSYNKSLNEKTLSGPSYVCFYPQQPSQHLDLPESEYANDGFDIINDINATGSFCGPLTISDLQKIDDNDYIIPAFGVEYGSQKQSIFKNININMDNPQTTEISVANMFNLANSSNEDMKKVRFTGQDLYKIYSNYSYTCQVEMMGCAQIQPLMYFQLNNIPLFRGAYMIINVEHDISPGDMTTKFKGVRLNRTKMPMESNCITTIDMQRIFNNNNVLNCSNNTLKPLNIQDIPHAESRVNLMNINITVTSKLLKDEYGEHIKFANGQEEAFNRLNPSLRNLVYCIVGDLKKMSEKLPYKIGILITSSTRDSVVNGNNSSDHIINGSPSAKRLNLKGLDTNGNEKLYSEMGCAIDFRGTKDGVEDRGEASINVFSHIANNYYDYIRQLIWEVKDQATCQNSITLIHLASYGKVGPNGSDKNQVYLSKYPEYSGTKTGSEVGTLPSEFIKILIKMNDNKRFEGEMYVNNFPNGKPTKERLEYLLEESIKLC